jgi:hypothetical protein
MVKRPVRLHGFSPAPSAIVIRDLTQAKAWATQAKAWAWSLDISKDGFRAEAQSVGKELGGTRRGSRRQTVECILSRRDSMIVARHEVPGKASLKRTVP